MQLGGDRSQPFNILSKRAPSRMPRPQQAAANCSSGATMTTISVFNETINQTVTYTVNLTSACTSPPAAVGDSLTASQTPLYNYQSLQTYNILTQLDCSFGVTALVAAIARVLQIDASQIVVVSSSCGSMSMNFQCLSAISADDADDNCQQIINSACNPTTQLYQTIQASSCSVVTVSKSSSNTALYGLFALIALPILCCVGIIIWYRSRQREADNQYMQDTATFSGVAASPQPIVETQYYPAPPEAYAAAANTVYTNPPPVYNPPPAYPTPATAFAAPQPVYAAAPVF